MKQASFDDLGTPLFAQTFVTLDLETTGGSPEHDSITEIGAVRSAGGQIEGTFQTLIRPDHAIRPFVELLTGISDVMVAPAPPITEVLPSLWEFLSGAVLVAHNARFDATFLSSAFRRHGYDVPFKKTVCTLRLARWLMKGETRNLKLESLASSLGVATQPCHRAFPDARATHEVFHRLLELAGPHGVLTVEDLTAFTRVGRRPNTAKAGLAAAVPRSTGVYKFLDRSGKVIYVGKAKNLRARVRSYFYGDERPKTAELVRDIARVEVELCDTELGAEVRELHLIRRHQPRYNRRGRKIQKAPVWLKVTTGSVPRVMVGRSLKDGVMIAGPFRTQRMATDALEAIRSVLPIPRCSRPQDHPQGCAFGQIGQCIAPCMETNRAAYSGLVANLVDDLKEGAPTLLSLLEQRMDSYSEELRYEEAATLRDRIGKIEALTGHDALVNALGDAGDVVICLPREEEIHAFAIRSGLLVAEERLTGAAPDPVRMFGLSPPRQPSDPPSLEDIEEMKIVWRFVSAAAASGGWVHHCSGVFASSAVRRPRILETRAATSPRSSLSKSSVSSSMTSPPIERGPVFSA